MDVTNHGSSTRRTKIPTPPFIGLTPALLLLCALPPGTTPRAYADAAARLGLPPLDAPLQPQH